jgi:hypothetical protein
MVMILVRDKIRDNIYCPTPSVRLQSPRERKANLGVSPLYCAAMRDSEQFQRMEAVSQENGKHRPVFGVL